MATINTGPTPVNTGTTTTTIGPLDRAPADVPPASDPGIPTTPPVYNQPVDRAPEPVEPGPGLGTNPGAAPAASIPIFEVPVEEAAPAGAGTSVQVATPVYIKVLSDGTVVTENTLALNFLGNGVSVSANGSTANITITAGGGGATYGNSNVVTLMSAFGSNSISTTGNITGGNISAPDGNGSILINNSGVIGAAAGFSYNVTANAMFVPQITASGNSTTGINAIYAGAPGYVVLGSSVMAQFTGNVNTYSQINFQNINNGTLSSGDYIITGDNGTDSTYYLDLGLAGSNHADVDFFGDTTSANDGYLYVTATDQAGPSNGAGNLILGSTNGTIKMFVGNTAQANVIQTVTTTGITVVGQVTTAPVPLANLTAVAGARAFVNNGNLQAAGNFGAQIGSGGSNVVPVWSNGTNWYIG